MNEMHSTAVPPYPRVAGRYIVFEPTARGGMASVHLGRLIGPVGFSRTVAIKRLHEQLATDPEFVAMFLDEARLVTRIKHPNVVPTLDVVVLQDELLLVMEYITGASLMSLLDQCRDTEHLPPIPIVADVVVGMLHGLHAAHEATDANGQLLNIVHRDVSPHNVLVGIDGVTRVVDFGIAKASGCMHRKTQTGELKGKLSYMAPEQFEGAPVSRAADIYSASVVLWEALTGKRLFKCSNEAATITSVLNHDEIAPSAARPEVPRELDAIVLRGLNRKPDDRWETARDMAEALEAAVRPVTRSAVGAWVMETSHDAVCKQQRDIAMVESYAMPEEGLPSKAPLSSSVAGVRRRADLDTIGSGIAQAYGSDGSARLKSSDSPRRKALRLLPVAIGLIAALTASYFASWRTEGVRPSVLVSAVPPPASQTAPPPAVSASNTPSEVQAAPDGPPPASEASLAHSGAAPPGTTPPDPAKKRGALRREPPAGAPAARPTDRLYRRD